MTKLPSAKIRDSLEQRIIEGELSIGKRLDESELSDHYGVSRTPVREALQRLAESGLAEHLPRRGTFVRAPSLSELVEMFEVMAELECMAVRLATRRATNADIDTLTDSNEACRAAFEAGDIKRYYELNAAVHRQIYKMSGNGFLAAEAQRLHGHFAGYNCGCAAVWANPWTNMISFWPQFVTGMSSKPSSQCAIILLF